MFPPMTSATPAPSPPPAPGDELSSLVSRTEGVQPWRRVFHAASGIVISAGLLFVDPPWLLATAVLGGITLLLLAVDLARLGVPAVNRLFFRLLRRLASPREARRPASSTWYMAGCFVAVAVFPRSVAVASILVLALADPLASYVGRRWGRRPWGSGTVEGSAVFLSVAVLVLWPVAGWGAALVAAVGTTLVERIPWALDDNLTVPLTAGFLLWSLLPYWG